MEKAVTCSKSEKDYIDARMKPVEEIVRNPSKYEDAQKNVQETIDRLCEECCQCSMYIQQKYGELCAKYGLDWYAGENSIWRMNLK